MSPRGARFPLWEGQDARGVVRVVDYMTRGTDVVTVLIAGVVGVAGGGQRRANPVASSDWCAVDELGCLRNGLHRLLAGEDVGGTPPGRPFG